MDGFAVVSLIIQNGGLPKSLRPRLIIRDEFVPLTELRSIETTHNRTPSNGGESGQFGAYIAAKNAEIARLSMENAKLLKDCATKQTDHVYTMAKYRHTHERCTHLVEKQIKLVEELRNSEEKYNKRLNDRKDEIRSLNQSLHKRVREKEEAIRQAENLIKENACLLKVHAELGEEIAALKKENADLVQTVYPLESKIRELQASAVTMKELKESYAEICEGHGTVMSENQDWTQQVSSHNLMIPHSNVSKHAHSHQRSESRVSYQGQTYDGGTSHSGYDHDYRGGNLGMDSSYCREVGLPLPDSYDIHVPDRCAQHVPQQDSDHTHPIRRDTYQSLVPYPSPNASHRTLSTADAVGSWKNDKSRALDFALVPRGPKVTTGSRKKAPSKKHKSRRTISCVGGSKGSSKA